MQGIWRKKSQTLIQHHRVPSVITLSVKKRRRFQQKKVFLATIPSPLSPFLPSNQHFPLFISHFLPSGHLLFPHQKKKNSFMLRLVSKMNSAGTGATAGKKKRWCDLRGKQKSQGKSKSYMYASFACTISCTRPYFKISIL